MEGTLIARRFALAAGLVAILVMPGAARAGSVDISSSMSGWCIGRDCRMVRFVVDLPAHQAWADRIMIFNQNPARWKFAALRGASDANGADLGWSGDLLGNDFLLRSPGPIGTGSVHLTVQMSEWGDFLFNNHFDFVGEGVPGAGTVTPEPASMLLLGTGLAGVAGAARRRRIRKLSDV